MQELGFLATNQYGRICFHLGNLCLPFHHSPLPYMSSGKKYPWWREGGQDEEQLRFVQLEISQDFKKHSSLG